MKQHRIWYIAAILLLCVSAIVGCHHGGYGGGYGSCPPQSGYGGAGYGGAGYGGAGYGGAGYGAPGGTYAPQGGAPYQAPAGSGAF